MADRAVEAMCLVGGLGDRVACHLVCSCSAGIGPLPVIDHSRCGAREPTRMMQWNPIILVS
jgi:hypothetical protein